MRYTGLRHVLCSLQICFLSILPLDAARPASRAHPQGAQVTRLRAWHLMGQTFLTWQEADPIITVDSISARELRALRLRMMKEKRVLYRIYRSRRRVTSVDGLAAIAEVPPLTCWNDEHCGAYPRPQDQAMRYVVKEGEGPVRPGTGIYALHPRSQGRSFYAVTAVHTGRENRTLGAGNVLAEPIRETVGRGDPVLQRTVAPATFQYIKNPTLHYYVRWEGPPNCSVESKPFDYVVAIPSGLADPAPVGIHLHCWGGNLNRGYGWWYNAEKGAILIASNQIPYDWWTGYHKLLWTGKPLKTGTDWRKGAVRSFTQQRLLSFLDWVATRWRVDLTRTFAAGSSMGGSGSPMFAIRFPERIAWAVSWVGVHVPAKSPRFKGSYERVYGKPEYGVLHETGVPVWDYYNDAWYLRRFPGKETGFVSFANGKNDNGIGWPQAVEFLQALQDTKRPHLFVWGLGGHLQRARMPMNGRERIMPIDIRTDQSLPAFTHCSLDSDPGTGAPKSPARIAREKGEIERHNKTHKRRRHLDPYDGDPSGQINAYLYWETNDVVDEKGRWEMTVALFSSAPAEQCTVALTPRRCQKFRPNAGGAFTWTNTSLGSHQQVQRGQAIADEHGLITLDRTIVSKGKNRIRIARR